VSQAVLFSVELNGECVCVCVTFVDTINALKNDYVDFDCERINVKN